MKPSKAARRADPPSTHTHIPRSPPPAPPPGRAACAPPRVRQCAGLLVGEMRGVHQRLRRRQQMLRHDFVPVPRWVQPSLDLILWLFGHSHLRDSRLGVLCPTVRHALGTLATSLPAAASRLPPPTPPTPPFLPPLLTAPSFARCLHAHIRCLSLPFPPLPAAAAAGIYGIAFAVSLLGVNRPRRLQQHHHAGGDVCVR